MVQRVCIIFMPVKYQPECEFLKHVRTSRVHLYTVIQVLCLALLWTVKSIKQTSMAFPILVSISVSTFPYLNQTILSVSALSHTKDHSTLCTGRLQGQSICRVVKILVDIEIVDAFKHGLEDLNSPPEWFLARDVVPP